MVIVILWSNTQCTNGNNVPLTNDADGTSQCGTIGNTPIRAIQLVGNCRGA